MAKRKSKETVVFVDPPDGWRYGFPKPLPPNVRKIEGFDFHDWLIQNGYPKAEVDRWINDPRFGYVPCGHFEGEEE